MLVGGGGRLAKALTDAVKAAGGRSRRHRRRRARARDRQAWIDEQASSGRRAARRRRRDAVAEHLGEDVGRLDGILADAGARPTATAPRCGPADVEPFLGEAGGVPPWDLTDAIDAGDTAGGADAAGRA